MGTTEKSERLNGNVIIDDDNQKMVRKSETVSKLTEVRKKKFCSKLCDICEATSTCWCDSSHEKR